MNRIPEVNLKDEASEALGLLAYKIKEHRIPEVRKYYEELKGTIEL